MQYLKSLKNIHRHTARATKLNFHYYHSSDKDNDIEEQCIIVDHSVQEAIEEPKEYQVITKIIQNKCDKHSDIYSFHDTLIQTVCHIQTQPSNKRYFEPKGLLSEEMKTITK